MYIGSYITQIVHLFYWKYFFLLVKRKLNKKQKVILSYKNLHQKEKNVWEASRNSRFSHGHGKRTLESDWNSATYHSYVFGKVMESIFMRAQESYQSNKDTVPQSHICHNVHPEFHSEWKWLGLCGNKYMKESSQDNFGLFSDEVPKTWSAHYITSKCSCSL